MRKILIVSTVSRQFYLFEQGNIEVLHSLGYEVHCAANFEDTNERLDSLDIIRHHFDIQRAPFAHKNIEAYIQLKRIMESENFEAVHCHSPMGGVLTRLAAKSVGISKVIYTAHGFHFYKGAPVTNWLFFYPVERWLSRYTSIQVTINKEDYARACKFNTVDVEYVPGIGVDSVGIGELIPIREEVLKRISVPSNSFVLISVGELNKNKNHETVIKAISKISYKEIVYLICGKGPELASLKRLVDDLDLNGKVKFLGYRNDVIDLYKVSDLFVFPSFREGLSVSLMEAMSAKLPCVVSKIRGNIDLIDEGKGGFLVSPNDVSGFAWSINKLIYDKVIRIEMGEYNRNYIRNFDTKIIKTKMGKVYEKLLDQRVDY